MYLIFKLCFIIVKIKSNFHPNFIFRQFHALYQKIKDLKLIRFYFILAFIIPISLYQHYRLYLSL